MEEMIKFLRAMVLLQLAEAQATADREGRTPKFELLLSDAGFTNAEVAQMLGKSVAAAAKAISRGRAARRGAADVADVQPERRDEEQR
jgi:DNA-directed RNA polymerase specialized sigma24 family protein